LDSNLTGRLDSFSFLGGFGYNPRFAGTPAAVEKYGLWLSYGLGRIPGLEKLGVYCSLGGGMFGQKTVDSTNAIKYWNDCYSFSGSLSANYRLLPRTSVGVFTSYSRSKNETKINYLSRSVDPEASRLGTGASLSFDSMDYLEGGTTYRGLGFSVSDSVNYDLQSRSFGNLLSLSAKGALLPTPFLNCVFNVSFQNSTGDPLEIGGYYSRLRGFQNGEIAARNAIILNNEDRLTLARNFLFGRISAAAFVDSCLAFDSAGVALHTGAGFGLRYRPNFMAGEMIKVDVGFDLEDLARFPEITVAFGELF
jgi:hypothetical protein